MSQKPISHSSDLTRLRKDGFNIEIRSGYLLVKEVPYLNANKEVCRGILVVKLKLSGHQTQEPDTHVAYFTGEYPCDTEGNPITAIHSGSARSTFATDVVIDHTFSANPKPAGKYSNYYDQVSTYCSILGGPAKVIDPSATAKTFTPVASVEEDDCPFNYLDTASSRAEIEAVSQKLALQKLAIVGLGGTGAYILDLIAKTPVREINLFDKDQLFTHNAFRAPGAASLEELHQKPNKVDYFAAKYANMHRNIIPHAIHIEEHNVELLRDMDFVFLSMDDGCAKRLIVQKLDDYGIPFVDVGMGVYLSNNSLGGMLRVTTSTAERRHHTQTRIPFAAEGGPNEYAQNIQIADLNMLNAALAVIKWKKLYGFYMDYANEYHSIYGIEAQMLSKDECAA